MIATTGHGGGDEAGLGPVTDEVLRRVHQPVLVVGPVAAPATGDLMLAVDATGIAHAALPFVEAWLRTFGGGTPRVVEVLPPDPWPSDDAAAPIGCVDEYVGRLAQRRIESSEVLRALDPALALAAHAASCHASMLVVTSPHDPGQPSHWYETARRLVRTSPCPVLVVPVA